MIILCTDVYMYNEIKYHTQHMLNSKQMLINELFSFLFLIQMVPLMSV